MQQCKHCNQQKKKKTYKHLFLFDKHTMMMMESLQTEPRKRKYCS